VKCMELGRLRWAGHVKRSCSESSLYLTHVEMEREEAVMANLRWCDESEDVARVGRRNWRFNGGSALRRSGPSQGCNTNGGGGRRRWWFKCRPQARAWLGWCPVTRFRAGPLRSFPDGFCSSAKRSNQFWDQPNLHSLVPTALY
jgi:hypothetical protein